MQSSYCSALQHCTWYRNSFPSKSVNKAVSGVNTKNGLGWGSSSFIFCLGWFLSYDNPGATIIPSCARESL